ncbi:hypothetical protein LPJ70_005115 [Coemansia sp. RSA 2708]|nr:hypothetical protein LPJ70_005115 [Coemansia sp. RSA 2708]
MPARQERKLCHQKRDAYYQCLDKHGIEDPATAGTTCQELRQTMHANCPEAWADYFEKLRAMKKRQERLYKDRPEP